MNPLISGTFHFHCSLEFAHTSPNTSQHVPTHQLSDTFIRHPLPQHPLNYQPFLSIFQTLSYRTSKHTPLLATLYYVKYRNFNYFPRVEMLWKGTVSAKFQAIHPKLCGNYSFTQSFNTKKLGEIKKFYAVFSQERQAFQH